MIGAMAHPLNRAIIDPGSAHRHRGLRHPAAAGRRQRADRRRARGWPPSTPGRPASTSTLAPSPTPTRTSMARASSPAKASTRVDALHAVLDRALSPQFPAQPRPDRGRICARRPGQRYRGHRRLSVALQRLHAAQASLGARRLADRPMDVLAGARTSRAGMSAIPSRPSRAGRSSTIFAGRWWSPYLRLAARRMARTCPAAALLDSGHAVPDLLPTLLQLVFSVGRALRQRTEGMRRPRPFATLGRQRWSALLSLCLSPPPDSAGARRDHPRAGSTVHYRPASAGVGDRCRSRSRQAGG